MGEIDERQGKSGGGAVMNVRPNWVVRQVRWMSGVRTPLARRWDRLEAGFVLVAILLSLGTVPVAVAIGSRIHAEALATSAEQQATRVPGTAVLLAAAPDAIGQSSAIKTEPVRATWPLADGSHRTGIVDAVPGTAAGSEVPIWLDPAGNPASAPMTRDDALGLGVAIAMAVWFGAVALSGLLVWLARVVLDRRRAEEWASEWQQKSRDLKKF
jgi:hypothetical protein